MTSKATFHHEALFYAGDEDFVDRCRAFVEEGLDQGEPVLVMVGSRKLELLREGLGSRAEDVHFADMEVVGRNPARIIPAWARFVSDQTADGGSLGMRGIGEPIWTDRRPDELEECQLHESLINLAFAAADSFRLVCPYDTTALPDDVIAEARRSHPVVSREGTPVPCGDYCGMDKVAARFSEPLSEPPDGAEEHTIRLGGLREARGIVREHALAAGLGARSDDFVLAVNEVLSNSLQHAEDDGALRIWDEPDGLVCEVRDRGYIAQPLIGREEPTLGQVGGARHLARQPRLRSGAGALVPGGKHRPDEDEPLALAGPGGRRVPGSISGCSGTSTRSRMPRSVRDATPDLWPVSRSRARRL